MPSPSWRGRSTRSGGAAAGPASVRAWMTRLLEPDVELTERSRIIAEYCLNAIRYWRTSDESVVPAMARVRRLLPRAMGDRRGEALALASLAVAQFAQDPARARGRGGELPAGARTSPTSSTSPSAVRWSGSCSAASGSRRAASTTPSRQFETEPGRWRTEHRRHARPGDRAQPPRLGSHARRRARARPRRASASSSSSPPPSGTRRASRMRSRGCSRSLVDLGRHRARRAGCSARPRTSASGRACPPRSPLLVLRAVPRARAGRARRVALRAGAPDRARRRTRRRRRGRARLTGAANGAATSRRSPRTAAANGRRLVSPRRHDPQGCQAWCMPGCGLGGSDSVNSPWGSEASWVSGCRSVDV